MTERNNIMQYKQIGENSVSLLGFGCMRFPTMKSGKINRTSAKGMLDKARLAGVNYFDTAYPYHGGESELFMGEYLSEIPRDEFYLATKLPCWEVNTLDDAKRIFSEQLKRLKVDYFDFYLMHALNKGSWEKMESLAIYDFLSEMKKRGKIRNLGFSFHDDFEVFKTIIEAKKWDFCQIQLNYMDFDTQAGMKGYELSEKLGVPLVIMEPIKGGSLANLPEEAKNALNAVTPDKSDASWALRWVGTLPNVKVILSGMSKREQVIDNLRTFKKFAPLSEEEQAAVTEVRNILASRVNIGCTGCRYCMPCPFGVDIPRNFYVWNNYGIYANNNETVWSWKSDFPDEAKAKNCRECGKCEEACPQKLKIRENLKALQSELDGLNYK